MSTSWSITFFAAQLTLHSVQTVHLHTDTCGRFSGEHALWPDTARSISHSLSPSPRHFCSRGFHRSWRPNNCRRLKQQELRSAQNVLAPAICVTLPQSITSWHKHRQNKLSNPVSPDGSWYVIKWPCRTVLKGFCIVFAAKDLSQLSQLNLHLRMIPSSILSSSFPTCTSSWQREALCHLQNRCTAIGDAFGFTLVFNVTMRLLLF